MAGLKTFLGELSLHVGVTPAALYERQRVLVNLGLIKTRSGRGPGSGATFTAENLAALVISILATDSLSEVDQRVVALCNAPPAQISQRTGAGREKDQKTHAEWVKLGKPTFQSEVARVLAGQSPLWQGDDLKGHSHEIRVTRMFIGEIDQDKRNFSYSSRTPGRAPHILIKAVIDDVTLGELIRFTKLSLEELQEDQE